MQDGGRAGEAKRYELGRSGTLRCELLRIESQGRRVRNNCGLESGEITVAFRETSLESRGDVMDCERSVLIVGCELEDEEKQRWVERVK